MTFPLKTASALMLAFAFSACGESTEDIAAKAPLVDALVSSSSQACKTDAKETYAKRLQAVLSSVPRRDIETIKDNGVIVCLDRRLAAQHKPAGMTLFGVYDTASKTISLYDDETQPVAGGITNNAGPALLTQFAAKIRNNGIQWREPRLYGTQYLTPRLVVTRWEGEDTLPGQAMEKNRGILAPPLK